VAYRNKTYVCFASEDIVQYYLMTAWKENEHIDFNFHDAHDIAIALDTSQKETIRRRLRERLVNTKQAVLLIGDITRTKAADATKFLHYEIEVLINLQLPIVIANLNKSRVGELNRIPQALTDARVYTMSVSFQPKIIQYALDNYVPEFQKNLKAAKPLTGSYQYNASVYKGLGL
jgi:hypothetical protein